MGTRAFRFAAEPALEMWRDRREAEQRTLAAAMASLEAERQKLAEIDAVCARFTQQIASAIDDLARPDTTAVDPERGLWESRRIEGLQRSKTAQEARRAEQVHVIEEASRLVHERREAVASADARVRSLEELRAKRLADHQAELARAEERQRAEVAVQGWLARQGHRQPG